MIEQFEAIFRFQNHLTSLGVPVNGIRVVEGGYEIDFKDEATPQQRALADAEKTLFDFRIRTRSRTAIGTWYKSLSNTDRTKILELVLADFIAEHPEQIEALGLTPPFDIGPTDGLLRNLK